MGIRTRASPAPWKHETNEAKITLNLGNMCVNARKASYNEVLLLLFSTVADR